MGSGLRIAALIYDALTVANMNAWHYWWVYGVSVAAFENPADATIAIVTTWNRMPAGCLGTALGLPYIALELFSGCPGVPSHCPAYVCVEKPEGFATPRPRASLEKVRLPGTSPPTRSAWLFRVPGRADIWKGGMLAELDRFRGCIVGLAVGDALGHPTEFVPSVRAIRARWGESGVTTFEATEDHPPGTFTDDTQMSIAAARALIRAGHAGTDRLMTTLAREFVAWAGSPENDRAPGGACMSGCHALAAGAHWREAGVAHSKGCGAAMRAAPFGLYFAGDSDALVRAAAAQSALTHRHPTGIASSVAAAAAVAAAFRSDDLSCLVPSVRAHVERVDETLLVDVGCEPALAGSIGNREMLASLDRVEQTLAVDTDDVCSLLGGAWVGEEAVATALWCVLRAGGDFRTAVLRGANSSGDSDSIACIAGAIAGAAWGLSAIGASWVRDVENAELLDLLARVLYDARRGRDTPFTGEALDPFDAERLG